MKQSVLAITIALATVISLAATPTFVGIRTLAQAPPPHTTQLPANIGNMSNPVETTNHLPVKTVQDDHFIVTTVTKSGEPPTGPIIVIPPEPGKPGNGTIITPGENTSNTKPGEGNITVISPGGNVTEIPGNITNVGNDTIIITEPGRNITETPGNVTVIDPPVGQQPPATNATAPPANCTCNQPAQIPPVLITPAPGQNVTTQPPVISQPPPGNNQSNPVGNESATGQPPVTTPPMPPAAGNNNETGGAGNQTGNTGGNGTQTPPVNNATNPGNQNNSTNTEPPHATQLPASATLTSPFLPGVHISSISYSGVNNQYLHK